MEVFYEVSIPQAVSAVATIDLKSQRIYKGFGFNTASGKCCCNIREIKATEVSAEVSIPQAVSAVATFP